MSRFHYYGPGPWNVIRYLPGGRGMRVSFIDHRMEYQCSECGRWWSPGHCRGDWEVPGLCPPCDPPKGPDEA